MYICTGLDKSVVIAKRVPSPAERLQTDLERYVLAATIATNKKIHRDANKRLTEQVWNIIIL